MLLKPGQQATVGHYTVRHDSIQVTDDGQKQMITAHLTVFEDGSRDRQDVPGQVVLPQARGRADDRGRHPASDHRGPLHRAAGVRSEGPVGQPAHRRQPAGELDLGRVRHHGASAPASRCCPSAPTASRSRSAPEGAATSTVSLLLVALLGLPFAAPRLRAARGHAAGLDRRARRRRSARLPASSRAGAAGARGCRSARASAAHCEQVRDQIASARSKTGKTRRADPAALRERRRRHSRPQRAARQRLQPARLGRSRTASGSAASRRSAWSRCAGRDGGRPTSRDAAPTRPDPRSRRASTRNCVTSTRRRRQPPTPASAPPAAGAARRPVLPDRRAVGLHRRVPPARGQPLAALVLVAITLVGAGLTAAADVSHGRAARQRPVPTTPSLVGGRTRAALERDKALVAALDQGARVRSRDGEGVRRRLRRDARSAARARRAADDATGRQRDVSRADRARPARGQASQAGRRSGEVRRAAAVPACGTANDADARFCKQCGRRW